MAPSKMIKLPGLRGGPETVGCVILSIRPNIVGDNIINIAPKVRAWFAIVPNLNVQVIITPNLAKLMESLSQYNIIYCNKNSKQEEDVSCSDKILSSNGSEPVVGEENPSVLQESCVPVIVNNPVCLGEGISQDVDTEEIDSQTDARFVKTSGIR